MPRSKHRSKEIEAVVYELECLGWTTILGNGHAWGIIRCPENSKDCRCGNYCQMSVWSTPKNPEQFTKNLRQKALTCVILNMKEGNQNG